MVPALVTDPISWQPLLHECTAGMTPRGRTKQVAADIQTIAHRALPNPSLRDVADRRQRPGQRTPRSHNALGLLGGLAQGQDQSTTLRA